jgi:hypothetical protein
MKKRTVKTHGIIERRQQSLLRDPTSFRKVFVERINLLQRRSDKLQRKIQGKVEDQT